MSDIIPRKKAIPVQARRADMPPEVIQIPGAPPIPAPPPSPGVTQNIIYVNVPAGQSPAPAPEAPTEVHFHTTNVYEAPKRRRRGRGTSFLGSLGFVLGGIAAGAAYVPQVMSYAKLIAEAGAVCAGLGLLGAMLFRRVGRGVPMLGLIVCGVAYCLMLKNSGQLPSAIALPKIDFEIKPAPPANPPDATPAAKPPANPPPADQTRLHDNTIFGDGTGGWTKPTDPTAVVPSRPVPAPAVPAPVAVSAIDPATATANLERARSTAAARLGLDYTTAKTAASEAQSDYQEAKIANAPGSPELISASQKHLLADSQLNLIETKLRADPAVAAAEAVLKNAKPAAR